MLSELRLELETQHQAILAERQALVAAQREVQTDRVSFDSGRQSLAVRKQELDDRQHKLNTEWQALTASQQEMESQRQWGPTPNAKRLSKHSWNWNRSDKRWMPNVEQ